MIDLHEHTSDQWKQKLQGYQAAKHRWFQAKQTNRDPALVQHLYDVMIQLGEQITPLREEIQKNND